MQSPPRSHVIAARAVLIAMLYLPCVVLFRISGSGWFYSIVSPLVWMSFGLVLGNGIGILMLTAAGVPRPPKNGSGRVTS